MRNVKVRKDSFIATDGKGDVELYVIDIQTPLEAAARKGDISEVESLLKDGANVNDVSLFLCATPV